MPGAASCQWYPCLITLLRVQWGNIIGGPLGFNFVYSSPGRYMTAKAARPPKPFPLRTDDIFPYSDGLHSMWSGYFTSRPALKGYVRDTTSVFAAARQLQLQDPKTPPPSADSSPLLPLEQALSITQHHDAVAGTSKQEVALDYAKRLSIGRAAGDAVMGRALAGLTGYTGASFVRCNLANATICAPLELGSPQVLVLYNSQSSDKALLPVRVPVAIIPGISASWAVLNATGGAVVSQLLPLSAADAHLRYEYYGYAGDTPSGNVSVSWLAFVASGIPPQGFATYFLEPVPAGADIGLERNADSSSLYGATAASATNTTISNGILTVSINPTTGLLASVANAATGLTVQVTQDLHWYKPVQGDKQASCHPEAGVCERFVAA
jgi:alpha-mannosidase